MCVWLSGQSLDEFRRTFRPQQTAVVWRCRAKAIRRERNEHQQQLTTQERLRTPLTQFVLSCLVALLFKIEIIHNSIIALYGSVCVFVCLTVLTADQVNGPDCPQLHPRGLTGLKQGAERMEGPETEISHASYFQKMFLFRCLTAAATFRLCGFVRRNESGGTEMKRETGVML